MQRTAVILVVGLSPRLLRFAPRLSAFAAERSIRALRPVLPALTCSVQSSILTGVEPREHGVVGNGWYNRELAEVQFWKQSNALVQSAKVWELARARDARFTCAQLFWWYNMYASVDYALTPRPMYPADGRKLPDVHSHPASLRDELQSELGQFPLFEFWGPLAGIGASRWIAEAAWAVERRFSPTLNLVYLPHLDYPLQRLGPTDAALAGEVAQIDAVAGELIERLMARDVQPIVVSEYGIEAVSRPVHVNRALREAGWLRVRHELGRELLDAGASDAFAVADHQVAQVYVRDATRIPEVRRLCRLLPGVAEVLARDEQCARGIGHARSGELMLIAEPGAWFTYYYWLDDRAAPDFARTVDIHRKPGYDPAELFLDPRLAAPKLAVGWRLLKRRLGFRTLLDVIPLDATLVRGSHGRVDIPADDGPLVIAPEGLLPEGDPLPCTHVRDLVLASIFS